MTRQVVTEWALAASIISLLAASTQAAVFRAGTVKQFRGKVLVWTRKGSPKQLTAQDIARPLFVGDRIQCTQGARLTIRFRDGIDRSFQASKSWVALPLYRTETEAHIYGAITGGSDPYNAAVLPAVKHKGQRRPVVADQDSVPCSLFEIVLPEGMPAKLTLRVRVDGERTGDPAAPVLFVRERVRPGRFRSAELGAALRRYRSEGERGPLIVDALDERGKASSLDQIFLMDEATERLLALALAQAESEPDEYARALARACAFLKFGLREHAGLAVEGLPRPIESRAGASSIR